MSQIFNNPHRVQGSSLLEILNLILSSRDAKQFKVIVKGYGETESSLPFFEGEQDWRTTVLRCLEVTTFNSKHFDPKEQEWMVKANILNENKNYFDDKYLSKIGQAVYQALFPANSKAREALIVALGRIQENGQLHIQLEFSADVVKRSRLADYPWELLHNGQKFLFQRNVIISRYIADEAVPPKLPPTDKVNVLLMSSCAWDSQLKLERLDNQEKQAIREGLQKARDAGHINLVELKDATTEKLREFLTENQGEDAPHVLHFDGHGLFGKRCSNLECRTMHNGNKTQECGKCHRKLPEPQGYLVFEDGDKADYISAEAFRELLRLSSLRDGKNKVGGIALVVLSACQSAMALDGDSLFNGVAQNLISTRIPSVVAMQYSVSVESAKKFAEEFYHSLGLKNSLVTAISQARGVMDIEGNQWYRPVLYLRWQDNEGGQLFKDFLGTDDIAILDKKILQEENKPRQISRITQIKIDRLKHDLDKLVKDYKDVGDKHRRESNPQEQNNLQLQLDKIAKEMEWSEQQLQELGYGYE